MESQFLVCPDESFLQSRRSSSQGNCGCDVPPKRKEYSAEPRAECNRDGAFTLVLVSDHESNQWLLCYTPPRVLKPTVRFKQAAVACLVEQCVLQGPAGCSTPSFTLSCCLSGRPCRGVPTQGHGAGMGHLGDLASSALPLGALP